MKFSWQLLAVCSALSAIFGKVGVTEIPPDLATLFRTLVLLIVFVALVSLTGQWQGFQAFPGRAMTFLALSAFAGAGSWFFYFRAVQAGDVSRVQPIDKLSIVFVAIFGVTFLGERLSLSNWLGIALMSGGLLLVALR